MEGGVDGEARGRSGALSLGMDATGGTGWGEAVEQGARKVTDAERPPQEDQVSGHLKVTIREGGRGPGLSREEQ